MGFVLSLKCLLVIQVCERKRDWMNEWMIEWMNEWMNDWMNEWIDWMNESIGWLICFRKQCMNGELEPAAPCNEPWRLPAARFPSLLSAFSGRTPQPSARFPSASRARASNPPVGSRSASKSRSPGSIAPAARSICPESPAAPPDSASCE